MSTDPVVIVAARRTPIGAFQGALSDVSATELGATAVAAAVAASGVDPADVGRVLMGCVLPAGLGQAPARQAALGGGLPKGVPCSTVNKMCGSGMGHWYWATISSQRAAPQSSLPAASNR